MSELTRAFLALLLPPEAIRSAAAGLEMLRGRIGAETVKWVPAENLHVTLRFFGSLGPDELQRARGLVVALGGNYAPLVSAWTELGAFPSARRVQVIWLGLADPDGHVRDLVRTVNEQLLGAGFGPPDKPFQAHVTLGRVRREKRMAWSDLGDGLTIAREAFSIARIALMQSQLTPAGPIYTPLETAPARGAQPPPRDPGKKECA